MNNVGWFDAVLYCNWLSSREGRKPCYERTGENEKIKDYQNIEHECDVWRCDFVADGYRLPTEAEWEYACRAGGSGAFFFDDDESRLPQFASFIANAKDRTWPAGTRLANAWGLLDMPGNVWEWCWDWLAPYGAGPNNDPVGPAAGAGRVIRGGAFGAYASRCRSAYRYGDPPVYCDFTYGFRVCCGDPAVKPSPPAVPALPAPAPTTSSPPNPPQSAVVPFDATQAKQFQEAWAKHLGHRVVETNSIGMKLVLIPSGNFMMGTVTGGGDDEKPAHEVTLSRPYFLGDREVTVEQFQRCVNDAQYFASEQPFVWPGANEELTPTADCPALKVNWFDAVLFCNWLSAKEGRKPAYERTGEKEKLKDHTGEFEYEADVWRCEFAADGYRLPTEAEWEYTCRAGSSGAFCFGNDEAGLPPYGSFAGSANGRTWPAATRLATGQRLGSVRHARKRLGVVLGLARSVWRNTAQRSDRARHPPGSFGIEAGDC